MSFRKCHVFIFHYGAILEKENKGASQGRMWKRFASSRKTFKRYLFSIFFLFVWLFFKRPKQPNYSRWSFAINQYIKEHVIKFDVAYLQYFLAALSEQSSFISAHLSDVFSEFLFCPRSRAHRHPGTSLLCVIKCFKVCIIDPPNKSSLIYCHLNC